MNHEVIEKNIWLMVPLIILAISFGSLVELVPWPRACVYRLDC